MPSSRISALQAQIEAGSDRGRSAIAIIAMRRLGGATGYQALAQIRQRAWLSGTRRALELVDPGYGPAMARIAQTLAMQGVRGWIPLSGPEAQEGIHGAAGDRRRRR